MKRLIPLIVGLILGTGGGSGLYIMRGGGAEHAVAEDAEAHGPAEDTAHVAAADSAESADSHDEPPAPDAPDPEDEQTAAIAEALLADTGHSESDLEAHDAGTDAADETATSEETAPDDVNDESSEGGETPAPDPAAEDPEGPVAAGVEGAGASSSADLIGGPVDNEEAAKRVAKIFSQMQARDAARVLSLMERSEVELILKQLDNRSAAKILSGLSPEQAAALSAVLIRGGD